MKFIHILLLLILTLHTIYGLDYKSYVKTDNESIPYYNFCGYYKTVGCSAGAWVWNNDSLTTLATSGWGILHNRTGSYPYYIDMTLHNNLIGVETFNFYGTQKSGASRLDWYQTAAYINVSVYNVKTNSWVLVGYFDNSDKINVCEYGTGSPSSIMYNQTTIIPNSIIEYSKIRLSFLPKTCDIVGGGNGTTLIYFNLSAISLNTNNSLPTGNIYYNDTTFCYDGPSLSFPFNIEVSDPEGNTIYYSTTTYAANYSKYDYFTSWNTIGICPTCISYPEGSYKSPIYSPFNVTYEEDIFQDLDAHINYIMPVKDLTDDDMFGLFMPDIEHSNWIGIPLDRSLTNFNYQTDIKGLVDTEELNITFYSRDLVKFKDFRFWRNSTNLCVDADLTLLGCVGNYNDFRFKYNTLPTYNDSYITITPSGLGILFDSTTFNMSLSQPTDTNVLRFYYYTYNDNIIILNYDITGLTYTESWTTTKPTSVSLRKGYNNINILVTDSVHLGSTYNYFNLDVFWYDEAYCQYYNINQPNTTNYSYYNYSQNNYTYTGNYSTIQPDRVIFDLLRPPLQYYYDTMGWNTLASDALYLLWIFIFITTMISIFYFTKSLSFTTPMVTASSLCLICSLAYNSISHIISFCILLVFALTGPFILNFFNTGYNN